MLRVKTLLVFISFLFLYGDCIGQDYLKNPQDILPFITSPEKEATHYIVHRNNLSLIENNTAIKRRLQSAYYIVEFTNGVISERNKNLALPINHDWKLSDNILENICLGKKEVHWRMKGSKEENHRVKSFLKSISADVLGLKEVGNVITFMTNNNGIIDKIKSLRSVTFIDCLCSNVVEESQVRGLDLSLNNINITHNKFPGLKGENLRLNPSRNPKYCPAAYL